MKNLLIYYFAILLPIPLMVLSAKYDSHLFVTLLLSYYFYRGFVDGKRLIEKQLIPATSLWKAFVPFYTAMYFRELYFEY